MHVLKLLHCLAFGKNIKVVRPRLPEMMELNRTLPEFNLGRVFSCRFAQQPIGYRLFQNLHHDRRIFSFRLTQQQMNMFGHYDETNHIKTIPPPHLLQHREKDISSASRSQKRFSSITASGDEMKIALTVVPTQRIATKLDHGATLYEVPHTFSITHPAKTARSAAPTA